MNQSKYVTLFVPSTAIKAKRGFKNYENIIDGLSFAESIQQAIESQESLGFELVSNTMVASAKYLNLSYTEGCMLIFKRH